MNANIRGTTAGVVSFIFLAAIPSAKAAIGAGAGMRPPPMISMGKQTSSAPLSPSNPYALIIDRNAFRLNPMPPPPVPEAPKADLPVIKISGFLKVGNQQRVFFATVPKNPAKEPPTYFELGEGESEGILEVRKIYADKEQVDIVNSGTPMTLSVKDDSFVPKVATPKSTAPTMAGVPELPRRSLPAYSRHQPQS
jgi:hypothetical protein